MQLRVAGWSIHRTARHTLVVVVCVAVGFENGVQDQVVLPNEVRFSRLQGDLAAAAACSLSAMRRQLKKSAALQMQRDWARAVSGVEMNLGLDLAMCQSGRRKKYAP